MQSLISIMHLLSHYSSVLKPLNDDLVYSRSAWPVMVIYAHLATRLAQHINILITFIV